MKDENKTKKQLINELKEIRNQLVKQTQTCHKEVTQLLQEGEKRFSCLVESASDAILSVDRHGNITSWNRAAEIIFGYTADEIVGKTFVLLVPERFIEDSKKSMEQMVSMDTSYFVGRTFEHHGLRKDGSEFPTELSYATCETREGLFVTAIVRNITERKRVEEALKKAKCGLEQRIEERTLELRIANEQLKQDVTERKQFEEALRESEVKYRELVQNANSIILRMDLKGNVTFFNEFAQSFFGYSKGEIIGRNVVGTIVPEIDSFGRDLAAMIEDIGSQPELYENNENENMCKNGKRVWVSWTNKSICDKNGTISETICIGNDITDRKRAEEETKKFKTISEQADYGVVISDLEGNLIYLNNHFAEIHGYMVEEVIGQNLSIFHNEEQMNGVRKLNEELLKTGSFKIEEVWHKRKDSTVFPALMSAAVIKDDNGKPMFLSATAIDVTERKQAEKKLGETKDYLDNIIESSLDCILVSDNDGCITKANRSFINLLGYKEGEIIGKMMPEFSPTKEGIHESTTGEFVEIDKAFIDKTSEIVFRFLRDGKVTNWETYLVLKNKKVVPVDISIVVLYDDGQNRTGSVGVLRDITDRKRAEKEIIETKEFLENIFKTSVDGIIVTDQDSYITMVNDTTAEILACSRDELIGKHIDEFTPKEKKHKERVNKLISTVLEKGFAIGFEQSWLRKDGSLMDVETNAAALKDKKGDIIGLVASIKDISERKQVEKKLVEYQNRLKSLASQLTLTEEKDRRRFANYLHDQVGQALFISKLKLGTIKENASSTDMAESLEEIINIIEQTIKETRSLTFELSPPILYQLGLEAALEWLVEQMQERYGMTIYFEDDKRSKPLDESVLILLFRAVRELLTNVTKHAKAQNAKVITRRDGENIKIFVEDDGVGFTVSKNGSSNHKNDGFGLFSIEERLDSLGGHFEIESETGRGACITILAPLNSKKKNETGDAS